MQTGTSECLHMHVSTYAPAKGKAHTHIHNTKPHTHNYTRAHAHTHTHMGAAFYYDIGLLALGTPVSDPRNTHLLATTPVVGFRWLQGCVSHCTARCKPAPRRGSRHAKIKARRSCRRTIRLRQNLNGGGPLRSTSVDCARRPQKRSFAMGLRHQSSAVAGALRP
jgi:hypothetical protein